MIQPESGTTGTGRDQRERDVLDAVVSLVDQLLDDFDVVELLTVLTQRCVHLLDIESAGLLLADPTRRLHLMAATSDSTRDLELLQLQAEQGPCLDCYATGRAVSVANLHEHAERWPRFVEAADRAGFTSVHAVPMRAAGLVLGALGLFGTTPAELSADDLAVGQTLAHIATVAIIQERPPVHATVAPHMANALASRIVVEQAKGFLRERLHVTPSQAFELLRTYALRHGRHLTDVARALISDRAARPSLVDALALYLHERSD